MDRATRKVDELERQMEQADRASDRMGRGMDRAGRSTANMSAAAGRAATALRTGLVVAAAATVAAMAAMSVQAIRTGVAFNSMLEQVSIGFTTMLGSAEEAQTFIERMQRFAATTPFEFPELVTASQRMLAMGFSAESVLPTLRAVGDAVAALGSGAEGIDRVTRALGQMQAKGRVSAEELLQLTEAGIPAWEILAETLETDVAGAMDLVAGRAVDSRDAIVGLVEGIDKRFGGMMERQSQTLSGLFSTIKDEFRIALSTGLEPFFNTLKDEMGWVKDNLPEITSVIEDLAEGMGRIFSFLATETRKFMEDLLELRNFWNTIRIGSGVLDPGERPPWAFAGGNPLPGYDAFGNRISESRGGGATAVVETAAERTARELIRTDPAFYRGMPFTPLHYELEGDPEIRQGKSLVVESVAGFVEDFGELFEAYFDGIKQRIDIAQIEGRSGALYEAMMYQNVLDFATGRDGDMNRRGDLAPGLGINPNQRRFVYENQKVLHEIDQRIERLLAAYRLEKRAEVIVDESGEIVTEPAFHRDLVARRYGDDRAFGRGMTFGGLVPTATLHEFETSPAFKRGMTFGGPVPTATLHEFETSPAFKRGMTFGGPTPETITATLAMAIAPMAERFNRLRLELDAGLVTVDDYRLGLFDIRGQLNRSAAEFGGLANQSDEVISFVGDLRRALERLAPVAGAVVEAAVKPFGRAAIEGMRPDSGAISTMDDFIHTIEEMVAAFDPLKALAIFLVDVFGDQLARMLEPLRIIAEVFAIVLTPAVKVVSTILASFGWVVAGVSLVIAKTWNALIDLINWALGWLGVNLSRYKVDTDAIADSMGRLVDIMDGTADATEDAGEAMRDFAQILNAPEGFVVGRFRSGAQDPVMVEGRSAARASTINVTIVSNDPNKIYRELEPMLERNATRRTGAVVPTGPQFAT